MEKYVQYVEKHRELILDALDYIWKNPEIGYKEWKTHRYLAAEFEKLGYELKEAGNIPGFTAEIDTGRPGPTVLVFGEMDGLVIPEHPEADPETGAVHACGHCAQVAALLGLAAALKEPGALDGMCGKIRLCAVPAEEMIDIEWRLQQRAEGTIRYLGGKPEFLSRGLLDDVDLAFMVHTSGGASGTGGCNGGSNGLIAKTVCFEGVSAHAGGAPHKGVNALYAANLALNAINALRETVQDSAHVRVHPIITHGGSSVNAIPDRVTLESYVRGADMDTIAMVNRKVNRAIAASAAAIGAKVQITDFPGYWPRNNFDPFVKVFGEAMECVMDSFYYNPTGWGTGCSDMGDISSLMPAIHPYAGGATGTEHGDDYKISDPETACVKSAAGQLIALKLLLENDASRAKEIVESYKPFFKNKEEYFAYVDKLDMNKQMVIYEGDQVILDFA